MTEEKCTIRVLLSRCWQKGWVPELHLSKFATSKVANAWWEKPQQWNGSDDLTTPKPALEIRQVQAAIDPIISLSSGPKLGHFD